MRSIITLAAAAAIALPIFVSAGALSAPIEEQAPLVIEEPAGSSGGSLGSAGGGVAAAVAGLLLVGLVIKANDDTN